MTIFSEYRDIAGKPNEGIHALRVCGFAAVDVLLTVMLAAGGTWFLCSHFEMSVFVAFLTALIVFFMLAILVHFIFGVQTRLNTILGIAPILDGELPH